MMSFGKFEAWVVSTVLTCVMVMLGTVIAKLPLTLDSDNDDDDNDKMYDYNYDG